MDGLAGAVSVQPFHHWLPKEHSESCVHEVCDKCGLQALNLKRKSGWDRYWVTDSGQVWHEPPTRCAVPGKSG